MPKFARWCRWAEREGARSGRLKLAALLWASVVLAAASHAHASEHAQPMDPVNVEGGRVQGTVLPSGVKAYLGVPFAAPPVGTLRWREPQPVQPWQNVLHADRFAPECIQTLRAHDINHYFGEEATSEDCLYLNVWVPPDATADSPKPVAVWIYGGGFTIGSAAMANYRGEALARKGIVYVSIAYRVGAMGFMAHPALTAESPHRSSGNQGLLDQVAALKWVQRNIGRVGGDAGKVTIMGQSAGAMSVSVLQASPLAKGLFQRVMGMSGGMFGSSAPGAPRSLSVAERDGIQLQEQLKAESLANLRALPADRILQAQLASQARYGPVVEGHLLPASPAEIFSAGKHSDVPAFLGFTHDESPSFALQTHEWARLQSEKGKSPAYTYQFLRAHPYAPGVTFSDHDPKTAGAYHAADVPYWLGTLDSLNLFRTTRNWTDLDRRLEETMMSALVAFVATGNPNSGGSGDWPAYRSTRPQIRELAETSRTVAWPNLFATNAARETRPSNAPGGNAGSAPVGNAPSVGEKPVLEDRYPARQTRFAGDVVGLTDLTFSTIPGFRPLTLDLYRPASTASAHPLVVYIHGGGWQSGHTRHSGAFENWPATLASIAARGYVVASLEYRLSGEAPFPAAIHDVKTAIRWLRANAREHGIDPLRVVIWGGSAGGQLAALAGMTCGVKGFDPVDISSDVSDCAQGVIAWYGIFDFESLAGTPDAMGAAGATAPDSAPSRYLGCALPACTPTALRAASVTTYVNAGDPPVLLIHGTEDRTVPIKQSRDFLVVLKKSKVPVELLELPGVDHSFIGKNAEATRKASVQAFEASLAFIDRVTSGHSQH
jgi:para-nitrobenzyl esterase